MEGVFQHTTKHARKGMPLDTSIRTQIGTLVMATSVAQLANGFFGTYVSLQVAIENFAVPGLERFSERLNRKFLERRGAA
jgi:putative Ca2+/H+ antiporter (TMEM165/GDT1 family)